MTKHTPTTTIIRICSISIIAISTAFVSVGRAEDEDLFKKKEGWSFNLGTGIACLPAFPGAKDYITMVFPDIKIEYGETFSAAIFEGTSYKVVNGERWSLGPIMKYDFGRTEDVDNPFRISGNTNALQGLGDMPGTFELGGVVEYSYEMFNYSIELRQGVGGHKGFVGETSFNLRGFIAGSGKPSLFSLGPRATFADSKYSNAYFGINQTQSANSGLDRYDAGAGLISYGIGAFAIVPLSKSITLSAMGGYDRYIGGAADSPLIRVRGSRTQFAGSLRISYEF